MKIKILLFWFILFFSPVLQAELTDFSQNIQKEEQENKTNQSEYIVKTNTCVSTNSYADNCLIPTGNFLFKTIFNLWWEYNKSIVYNNYPYENPPFFSPTGRNGKSFFVQVLSGYHNYGSEGVGWYWILSGRFYKIFGPQIDFLNIDDSKTYLNFTSLGFNLALIQWDYWASNFYLQYSAMRGVLGRNGVNIGFDYRFFLIKPISLSVKTGVQIYDNFSLLDVNGKLHIHFKRLALHIGYSLFSGEYANLEGWQIGGEMWF